MYKFRYKANKLHKKVGISKKPEILETFPKERMLRAKKMSIRRMIAAAQKGLFK